MLETKKQRHDEGAGEQELCQVDGEMHRLLKSHEQLVNNRNSVLLTPTADYHIALSMVETLQKRAKEAANKASSAAAGAAPGRGKGPLAGASSSSAAPAQPSRTQTPIIIVPSDPSAMVNMTNISEFLEHAHFVRTPPPLPPPFASPFCTFLATRHILLILLLFATPRPLLHIQIGPQERGKSRDTPKRLKEVRIHKVLDPQSNRNVRFRVIDNPAWLTDAEWEAVVAVFSNGKAWQFSEWKYKTPVDLFHRCTWSCSFICLVPAARSQRPSKC